MNALAMGLGRSGLFCGSGWMLWQWDWVGVDVIAVRAIDALATGWCRRGCFHGSSMDALAMGWGRSGRYCGSGMDALAMDGVGVDVIAIQA